MLTVYQPVMPQRSHTGLDLLETPDAYTVRVALPGLTPEQVDVQLEQRTLRITTNPTPAPAQEEVRYYHRGINPAGHHAITLPRDINPERVTADLTNGLLTITIPKAEQAKARKIPVAVN